MDSLRGFPELPGPGLVYISQITNEKTKMKNFNLSLEKKQVNPRLVCRGIPDFSRGRGQKHDLVKNITP